MNKFETLRNFENFYNLMHPAQENTAQVFAWFSGIPHPFFNAVMHLSEHNHLMETVDTLIRKAPIGVPISFWVHSQNNATGLTTILEQRGFQPLISCPLMSWSAKPVVVSDIDMRIADSEIFCDILSTVFHFNKAVRDGFSQLIKGKCGLENYLLYSDGQPVGTGSLFPSEKMGGIFNFAILPDHQKKGFGKHIMQYLKKRAYALGLEKLILLSSPETEKLYMDLDFEKCFEIDIYSQLK